MIKTTEITEIYPKIFRLSLTLSLDLKDVNIYLIAGEVPTLIDTGLKDPIDPREEHTFWGLSLFITEYSKK